MSEPQDMVLYVEKANVEAIIGIQKTHGDKAALIMVRGMLAASAFMLKMMVGPKVAAMELYTVADRYACE